MIQKCAVCHAEFDDEDCGEGSTKIEICFGRGGGGYFCQSTWLCEGHENQLEAALDKFFVEDESK